MIMQPLYERTVKKRIVLLIALIVSLVIDFFVVYFTAMQTRVILYKNTIYRGATYFEFHRGICIFVYFILLILTTVLVVLYAKSVEQEKLGETSVTTEAKYCKYCGKKIGSKDSFCSHCGVKLS